MRRISVLLNDRATLPRFFAWPRTVSWAAKMAMTPDPVFFATFATFATFANFAAA
jgi:hypothetical protein